jgi:hypothetical protein
MKLLLSFSFVLFFLYACTPSSETKSSVQEEQDNKTLVLPVDENTSNAPMFVGYFSPDNGENEYLYMINNSSQLLKYDLKNRVLVDSTQLHTTGRKGIGHELHRANFHIHTEDSIFISVPLKNHIVLLNSKGDILKKYDSLPKGFDPVQIYTLTVAPPFTYKNKIYASVSFNQNLDYPNYWKGNEMFSYELESKKFTPNIASFQSDFFGNAYPGNAMLLYGYTFNPKTSECVRSFPADPTLYVEYLETGKKHQKTVKSKYFDVVKTYPFTEDTKKMPQDELVKMTDEFFYEKSNEYAHIKYDPYRDVYYRFILHGTGKKPNKLVGNYEIIYGKRLSIIVMNSDFNILGESEIFPSGKYNYEISFISKEGLWLSRNFPHKSNIDEDKMVFELFEL